MNVDSLEKIWLSSAEAQKYIGMSADFLRDMRNDGMLHFYKVKGAIFYKKADIDKLIEKNKVI